MGILMILIGLFAIAGGAFDWNFFMQNHRAAFMTKILGNRKRARIFYMILGSGIIILGLLGLMGVVDLS